MRDNIIGRFAISKAGHDAGTVYMITAEDGMHLYLTDGKFHPLDKPKKKNRKHVRLMNGKVREDILDRLYKKERIFDHEIKYAIKTASGKEEGYV